MEYKILFLFIIFGPYFQPNFKVVAAQIETEIAEFELKKQQQADIFRIEEQAAYQLKSTEGNLNEVPQLIQEIDLQQRVTLYKWNSQNSTAAAAAVLKRNGIEKGKPLIVFGSTDEFGGGPTTSTRTYIVLRKAAQNPEILGNIYYYCNLVYIW